MSANFSNDQGTGIVIADGFQLTDGTPIGGATTYTVKAQSIGQNVVIVPITFLSNTNISVFSVTSNVVWTGAVNPVSAASKGNYLYGPLGGNVIDQLAYTNSGFPLFDCPLSAEYTPIANGLTQYMGANGQTPTQTNVVIPYIANNYVSTELTLAIGVTPYDLITYDWITGNAVSVVNTTAQIDYTIEITVTP